MFGLDCYRLVTNKNDFVKILGIANKCSEFERDWNPWIVKESKKEEYGWQGWTQ